MRARADRSNRALSIESVGMVTPLGLNAESSAAAIRARVSRFEEIPFHDQVGRPIIGSPAKEAFIGKPSSNRLVPLLERALQECVSSHEHLFGPHRGKPLPLLIAVDAERPDCPPDLGKRLIADLRPSSKMPISDSVRYFGTGKTAFFRALSAARILLRDPDVDSCIVSAVDSLLNARCLAWLEEEGHLKTESNSDGTIPGEAAAAVWVSRPGHSDHSKLDVLGLGFSDEPSVANPQDPNLAIGLAAAMRTALVEAGLQLHEIDYRVGGMTGERADFMEASIAFARILKVQRREFQLWVPAEKLGDVGTALPACMIVVTAIGMSKNYAPGSSAIASIAARSGDRAACVLAQPLKGNYGV